MCGRTGRWSPRSGPVAQEAVDLRGVDRLSPVVEGTEQLVMDGDHAVDRLAQPQETRSRSPQLTMPTSRLGQAASGSHRPLRALGRGRPQGRAGTGTRTVGPACARLPRPVSALTRTFGPRLRAREPSTVRTAEPVPATPGVGGHHANNLIAQQHRGPGPARRPEP